MNRRSFAALASVLVVMSLAGCGGSDGAALNPAFAGTWNGTSTLTAQGYSPISYAGQSIITVSGSGRKFKSCLGSQ
jgi:hypothetical protein